MYTCVSLDMTKPLLDTACTCGHEFQKLSRTQCNHCVKSSQHTQRDSVQWIYYYVQLPFMFHMHLTGIIHVHVGGQENNCNGSGVLAKSRLGKGIDHSNQTLLTVDLAIL